MQFPSRSTHKHLIESQELTDQDIQNLRLLADLIEDVVRSDEFEERVERNGDTYGHCAVSTVLCRYSHG